MEQNKGNIWGLMGLNYYMVIRVIMGRRSARKIGENKIVLEFLYQSGLRQRPRRKTMTNE